jgi:tryptophan aminotransferase
MVLWISSDNLFKTLLDDPYYYLYFGSAPRPPSYWELEGKLNNTRGRVLRFDSFSKVLSSGLRLGLVTGPKPIVDAINLHVSHAEHILSYSDQVIQTSSANLQVSSTTQAIAYAFLSEWGYETFFEHTRRVSNFYREKRDVFAKALDRHLTGLAEWTIPDAGMFFW